MSRKPPPGGGKVTGNGMGKSASVSPVLSLRTKLLAVYLPIVGITLLVFFAALETVNYRNLSTELHSRLEKFVTVQASALSSPLWNYDIASIDAILTAMSREQDLLGAVVYDQDGKILSSIGPVGASGDHLLREVPIRYMAFGEDKEIGRLKVIFRKDRVWRQVMERLIFDALILLLLAFVIAGVTLIVSHRIIGVPLSRLRESIELAKSRNVRVPVRWEARDELGAVVQAYNEMLQSQEKAERALQESERRYRGIVETALEGVLQIDRQGRVRYANVRAAALLGKDPEALQGFDLADAVDEDSREEYGALFRDGASGMRRRAEIRFDCGEAGKRWILVSVNPNYTADGSFAGLLAMLSDITDRKEREERLRESQRMEAIGKLTGGIAHDFNNLLAVIMGNLELLVERLGSPEQSRLAKRALHAAERGAMLTQRLLAFSRRQALHPETVDMNELVRNVADLLNRSLSENIDFDLRMEEDLWRCRVDPAQMENALLNLVLNARDAMPDGGTVCVSVGNFRFQETGSVPHGHGDMLPAGDYVRLVVSDNGCGMSEQVMERVFEPFYTTKSVGKGTGLGLSMVYGFVRQSGGAIYVDSTLGEGTTVTIYLPRAMQGEAPCAPRKDTAPLWLGNGELVLLVEDDASVRELTRSQLVALGYRVVEASEGQEAIDLCAYPDMQPDLVLADIILRGGIDGIETAERIREIYPDVAVAFMSGRKPDEEKLSRLSRLGATDILSKPFRKRDLAAALHHTLNRRDERRRADNI